MFIIYHSSELKSSKSLHIDLFRNMVSWFGYLTLLRMQVQKRFLKCVAFKLNLPLKPHNYDSIFSQIDLSTLIIQHEAINTISFLYNFINGHITSPNLLKNIQFNSPLHHHRYRSLFYVLSNNTNLTKKLNLCP